MADQQPNVPQEQPPNVAANTGSQVPIPSMIPGGIMSPNTEKQVSDLLAEMQQYAATAAPGTTTTMQFAYQKSKHTTESSGQEPQVVESSNFQKSIHQTPPPEGQQIQQAQTQSTPQPTAGQSQQQTDASQSTSIFSQIPQFLQEKLGLGGAGVPTTGQQHVEVSYQHSKSTTSRTTTSTTSGADTQSVTTTESHQTPPPTATQQTPAQESAGIFAPLKTAAEMLQEHVGQIPHILQEKLGLGHPTGGDDTQTGQKHVEMSYQHSKTTTTSSTSTADHQQQVKETAAAPNFQQTTCAPSFQPTVTAEQPSSFADKVACSLENLMGHGGTAAAPQQSAPTPGSVHIEVSKHASRQVTTQTGEQAPHIETTSSGYAQVINGIFNGMPVNGSVVPVIVPMSLTKSGDAPHAAAGQQPNAPQSCGTTIDTSGQLEEQLKKLGISAGHPVTDLLQQTLAQHQRAKTPEANIEIQYSAQRTHSSRTVTYEASGTDPKSAQEALQQLQGTLSAVAPPSQPAPDAPANTSKQTECVEGSHFDEDGNLVISKKTTRVTTTTRTVYDDGGEPKTEVKQIVQSTGDQPAPSQGQ